MKIANRLIWISALLPLGLFAGCQGRATIFPNSDKSLNRTAAEFAADAAKRHPFTGEPVGPANGRAAVDYQFKTIEILNSSPQDWNNVEVWVNRNYVCWLPIIPQGKQRVKTINFHMLYDDSGNYFWTEGGKKPVTQLEIRHDGKLYTLPMQLAD